MHLVSDPVCMALITLAFAANPNMRYRVRSFNSLFWFIDGKESNRRSVVFIYSGRTKIESSTGSLWRTSSNSYMVDPPLRLSITRCGKSTPSTSR